jgi:hypothetical protein
VRQPVDFYGKSPDKITEQELQDCFLHRLNTGKWSSATMRICYGGIKFYFINDLRRDWHTLELIYVKQDQTLLTSLSIEEVWIIINTLNTILPEFFRILWVVLQFNGRGYDAVLVIHFPFIPDLVYFVSVTGWQIRIPGL